MRWPKARLGGGALSLLLTIALLMTFSHPIAAPKFSTSLSVDQAYRAFKASSYWNTAVPADAARDVDSDRFISWLKANNSGVDHLQFSMGDFAMPVYWAASTDPLYTIDPALYGPTVRIRIPLAATAMNGSDGALVVFDINGDVSTSLWKATFVDGLWKAKAASRYYLSSNGLEGSLAQSDDSRNRGHRGIPPSAMMVRVDEMKAALAGNGAIRHKLEFFLSATGDSHHFPVTQHESGQGGIVGEGMLMRIKPGINLGARNLKPAALVVARALQDYGAVVGDNSSTTTRLKVERSRYWTGVLAKDDLASIKWNDFVFVRRGFGG